jgi:hypothetical protein
MNEKQLRHYDMVRFHRILAIQDEIPQFIETNRIPVEACGMMKTDISGMQMNITYRDKLLHGIAEDMRKKFRLFEEPPGSKDWYQFRWNHTDSTKPGYIDAELSLTTKKVKATNSSFSLDSCEFLMYNLEYRITHPPSPRPCSLRPSERSTDEIIGTTPSLTNVADASVLTSLSEVNTSNTA